jgi:hypothetical protein
MKLPNQSDAQKAAVLTRVRQLRTAGFQVDLIPIVTVVTGTTTLANSVDVHATCR